MLTVKQRVQALLQQLQEHPLPYIDLKLTRVFELMERLGNPQFRVPPVVHIAGTNGKGSTVANLKAMLEAHGKTVHCYTSPHLVDFSERITIQGQPIDDSLLADTLQQVIDCTNQHPVTWFESTTAAAFLAFARIPADIVLLETGLGGRLDATNIIERPALTAITPISMDHEQFLGNTITAIAIEKAGIIKPNVACVVAKQPPEAMHAIAAIAAEKHAPLWQYEHHWHTQHLDAQRCDYHSDSLSLTDINPALQGSHQLDNAAFAIACMDQLQRQGMLTLSSHAIHTGLSRTTWQARLQHMHEGALVQMLPSNNPLWLDGGHNIGAAEMLAQWLKDRPHSKAHIIIGMMQGRDAGAFLSHLAPYCASITTVTIPHQHDPQDAAALAHAASIHHPITHAASSIDNALAHVRTLLERDEDVLICGSLYLAGAVLAENSDKHH